MNLSNSIPLNIPGLATNLRLHVHGDHDRFVSRRIAEEGIWEPYETSLVMDLLHPGAVFVDVGANIGYFTVLAATTAGKVFAFEPDPENFRLLEANLALNALQRKVTAVPAALAEEEKQMAWIAERYKNVKGICIDICNEPVTRYDEAFDKAFGKKAKPSRSRGR